MKAPVNVVVNGASGGIGCAIVLELLSRPSVERVYASSRHVTSHAALNKSAQDEHGRLQLYDMDITQEASVATAANAIRQEAGTIDWLINCAGLLHEQGVMQPEKRLADVSPDNLHRSYAVNAIGPLLLARYFQAALHATDPVIFANLSARVGSIGDNRLGGWYAYRASKAAANMIIKNLSIELERRARGIVCVALHPGTVDTALSRPFQDRVPAAQLFTPSRAAQQLLTVMEGLEKKDNGGFFAWDTTPIPW